MVGMCECENDPPRIVRHHQISNNNYTNENRSHTHTHTRHRHNISAMADGNWGDHCVLFPQ